MTFSRARYLSALLIFFAFNSSHGSALALLETPYATGFRSQLLHDHSRSYEPASGNGRARPIRLYTWYPAADADGETMPFRRYVHFDHLEEAIAREDKEAVEARFWEFFIQRGLTEAQVAAGTTCFANRIVTNRPGSINRSCK